MILNIFHIVNFGLSKIGKSPHSQIEELSSIRFRYTPKACAHISESKMRCGENVTVTGGSVFQWPNAVCSLSLCIFIYTYIYRYFLHGILYIYIICDSCAVLFTIAFDLLFAGVGSLVCCLSLNSPSLSPFPQIRAFEISYDARKQMRIHFNLTWCLYVCRMVSCVCLCMCWCAHKAINQSNLIRITSAKSKE